MTMHMTDDPIPPPLSQRITLLFIGIIFYVFEYVIVNNGYDSCEISVNVQIEKLGLEFENKKKGDIFIGSLCQPYATFAPGSPVADFINSCARLSDYSIDYNISNALIDNNRYYYLLLYLQMIIIFDDTSAGIFGNDILEFIFDICLCASNIFNEISFGIAFYMISVVFFQNFRSWCSL